MYIVFHPGMNHILLKYCTNVRNRDYSQFFTIRNNAPKWPFSRSPHFWFLLPQYAGTLSFVLNGLLCFAASRWVNFLLRMVYVSASDFMLTLYIFALLNSLILIHVQLLPLGFLDIKSYHLSLIILFSSLQILVCVLLLWSKLCKYQKSRDRDILACF